MQNKIVLSSETIAEKGHACCHTKTGIDPGSNWSLEIWIQHGDLEIYKEIGVSNSEEKQLNLPFSLS